MTKIKLRFMKIVIGWILWESVNFPYKTEAVDLMEDIDDKIISLGSD